MNADLPHASQTLARATRDPTRSLIALNLPKVLLLAGPRIQLENLDRVLLRPEKMETVVDHLKETKRINLLKMMYKGKPYWMPSLSPARIRETSLSLASFAWIPKEWTHLSSSRLLNSVLDHIPLLSTAEVSLLRAQRAKEGVAKLVLSQNKPSVNRLPRATTLVLTAMDLPCEDGSEPVW